MVGCHFERNECNECSREILLCFSGRISPLRSYLATVEMTGTTGLLILFPISWIFSWNSLDSLLYSSASLLFLQPLLLHRIP